MNIGEMQFFLRQLMRFREAGIKTIAKHYGVDEETVSVLMLAGALNARPLCIEDLRNNAKVIAEILDAKKEVSRNPQTPARDP